jgi:hypothetical protein
LALVSAVTVALPLVAFAGAGAGNAAAGPDLSTLKAKVASVNGTAGLNIRFSAFIEQEAEATTAADVLAPDGATITNGGAGSSVLPPDVTVNQDTAAAPQNETSIAVDPNNPARLVGSANDYVTRTWSCTVSGTPCSALGDGYSGTYVSNDGGTTWCCNSSDPSHIGTLIPGVEHLTGGPYDAGGDPALAFDSRGKVYYAGLGFNRTSAPNTVTVNRGNFSSAGALSWSQPTFIDPTTSPAVFNDKEWIAADHFASSPYRDRVYVTFTRFVFSPQTGAYVQSPIFEAHSSDGGATFSTPKSIVGNVLYGQGSHPVVGPDGTVYVFWDGATRKSALDSTYMVKSTDGGSTWSTPVVVAPLQEIGSPKNTAFRVNSFPMADVDATTGALYATWSSSMKDSWGGVYSLANFCAYAGTEPAGCHAQAVSSISTDGGATWSTPVAVPGTDVARVPTGYPVTQPDGSTLNAPANPGVADSVFSSVAVSPSGKVVFSSYVGNVLSPWQTCTRFDPAASIHCQQVGPYIHNEKQNYVVTGLTGPVTTATALPINTRYMFRGGFIGDYTQVAIGSDNVAHPLWTDTNNTQTVNWFYGTNFNGLRANQQDVVTTKVAF